MRFVLFVLVLGACGPTPHQGGDGADSGDSDGDSDSGDGDGQAGWIDAAPGPDPDPTPDPPRPSCGVLRATVRDFKVGHPDFETFTADGVFPGLVAPVLGADGTPTYLPPGATPHTSGPAAFADWFHDVPGVNQAVAVDLVLTETTPGVFLYDDPEFFPIDGMGFGNDGFAHNFHFTTEIHTKFIYRGGEVFAFRGDDDVWVYINGKLAIDLGGLHQPAAGEVILDARAAELGITPGKMYAMDIFQAERHTTLSSFRIETTIECLIVE